MGRLHLTVLGPPELRHAGQVVKLPTRKALALLIYLCVEGGFHARDKLIALLWPESDAAKGRGSLRLTLTYLRTALRDADPAAGGPPLLSNRDTLGLDFGADWEMDLQLLQTATEVAREARSALAVEQRSLLQRAADSYRGDFLEGFSLNNAPDYDHWASVQREVWHRRASLIFDRLSQAQLEGGELVDAMEVATRWVAHDPLNESAHRRLMQIYLARGERTAAHQAYEACRSVLAHELNAEPSPETIALAHRIRTFVGPDIVVPGLFLPKQPAERRSLEAPLVGRSEDHLALVTRYRRVRRGECQVVLVEGEPGIGKTRLAGEFLRWAAAQGADTWHGRAFETGGRLPYQPLVQMLRHRLERENAPDDLLADLWLAELSHLLPELRERYPDLPPPMIGNADFMSARLFEAVARLGNALAAHRPLVLFVDDVQWADTGTRDLLHYLVHRWTEEGTPALLLLTARQEGMATTPELRDWLTGLERDAALTHLSLAPLTRADLHELVRTFAAASDDGEGNTRQLGDWLLAETGGSPFFIAEMLQMLQEQEMLVGEFQADGRYVVDAAASWQRLQAATHLPLPPNVRDVITTRLARLSEKAQALLLAGAVIGRRCRFELLCRVARLDEFEALPALEELLNSRLFLEGRDEARPFTLAHDNIRQVTYTEASTTRRRLYHRQALAALEQESAPPAELAFHAAAAHLPEATFRYAVAAGDAALALHAFADAVAHYGSALDLAEQVETTSAQRCHLCIQYGRALELSGRYIDALAHYEAMAHVAEQMDDRRLALAALVARGTIRTTANELSNFVLAERLGQQALALARKLEDKVAEAKVQWNLLNVYRMTHRYQRAQVAGEYALRLAQELGLREQTAFAANDLVYVYMTTGDIARALEMAQTATALWRELGNQPMLTDSLNSYAHVMAMRGEYATALAIAAEGLQIGRSLENQWSQSNNLISYGLVYWQQMAVDEVLATTDESVRLGQASGFVGAQVVMRAIQALVRLKLGDVTGARRLAEAALAITARNIPLLYATAAGTLALVALAEGRHGEAAEVLATVPKGSDLDAFNHFLLETALCQQLLLQADYVGANDLSTKVLAFLEERELRTFIPHFLYCQGQALVGLGQLTQAWEALESAVAVLRETGGRWQQWEIAALLADLAEADGNNIAAEQWRATARATIVAIADVMSDSALRETFLAQPEVTLVR